MGKNIGGKGRCILVANDTLVPVILRQEDCKKTPSMRRLRKTIRMFEPIIDDYMSRVGYRELTKLKLCEANDMYMIGENIIDIGSGSGSIDAYIIRYLKLDRIMDLKQRGNTVRVVLLDISSNALKKAKDRLEGVLEEIIQLYPSRKLTIRKTRSAISLEEFYGRKKAKLLTIRFINANAVDLEKIGVGNFDTVIITNCYHWFPGIEAKRKIAEESYRILNPGGRLLTIENYPYIIRTDMPQMEPEIVDALINTLTVLDCEERGKLFRDAGFRYGGSMEGYNQNYFHTQCLDYEKCYEGWPGWSLKTNIYGKQFDYEARERMKRGNHLFCQIIQSHYEKLGDSILEVGPFFSPLMSHPDGYIRKAIFFWENDPNVVRWLMEDNHGKQVFPMYCNLNKLDEDTIAELKREVRKHLYECGIKGTTFESVIMSQMFNYIDYKRFLIVLGQFLKKDALVFLNNVVDYGIHKLFSEKRPKSIDETIKSFEESGYEIIEMYVEESPDKEHQKNDRLILVARKI